MKSIIKLKRAPETRPMRISVPVGKEAKPQQIQSHSMTARRPRRTPAAYVATVLASDVRLSGQMSFHTFHFEMRTAERWGYCCS